MLDILKELCAIDGTSGHEDKVREYIINHIGDNEYTVDNLGNLIVEVKGKKRAKNKVMLCAHMDEVGIIATSILDNGMIKFITVGGIDAAILVGRAVRFTNGTVGIIGIKPTHLSFGDAKNTVPDTDTLLIDIGCDKKADTLEFVKPGDTAVFTNNFVEMGNKLLSKAIDDRAGCAVMLSLIKQGFEYDCTCVFSVQEEVGLRGAKTATFTVNPDYAIVLEATTAADIIDVPESESVCILGKGAAVSFMDRATIYNPALFKKAFELAEENNIKIQPKTKVAGGNDAGSVHCSRGGVHTLTINTPCRYIHSPSCVCDKTDLNNAMKLTKVMLEHFADA